MIQFVVFLRDGIQNIGDLLNHYTFDIAGLNVSILDLLIGNLAMGIIIAVFWKGAST